MMETASNKRAQINQEVRRRYSAAGFVSWLYTSIRLKLAPIVKVEEYVPKSGKILDLGCGNGMFANILLLGSPQRSVKGVDLDAGRIRAAQRIASGNSSLEFWVGDAGSFPLEQYDAITVIDLLHHMEFAEQTKLLKKLYERLADGAVLIIKDLEKAPKWKYWFHYVQDSISYRKPLYFRSAGEMETTLRRIGYTVEIVSLASGYMHPHVLYCCRRDAGN
jgi:2-polyprenyl-3-methyl-5-hydroxy-6-metoxy-1,4-benzoquinol methylase